jgi:hypothetical protein
MTKAHISLFSLSLALSCLVQLNAIPIPGANEGNEAPPRVTKSGGIERSFIQRAQLTETEEKVVLALAEKQGIVKVAKISSYNLYPTAARGIRVDGAREVIGRTVSFKVLNVNYKKWFHPGAGPRKGDVQIGDFWAGKAYERKQTILRVGETDYLCGSVRGIEIKECETILGLFLAGEFTYNPGARINDRLLDQVDWSKPSRFGKGGDAISVGFSSQKGRGGILRHGD